MKAETIYNPENNTYFGPNKPCMTLVVDQVDWSKGCKMLLERHTFGYKLRPRAGYKIEKKYVLEIWEYDSEGYPRCMHSESFKGKREAKQYFKQYVWGGNGNRESA